MARSSTDVLCLLQARVSEELASGGAPSAVSAATADPAAGQQQLQAGGAGEQARTEAPATHSAADAAPPSLHSSLRVLRSAESHLAELLLQAQPPRAWQTAAKVLSALVDARMQPTPMCQQRVAAWIAAGGPESAGGAPAPYGDLPWCQPTVLQAWAAVAMRSGGGEASRTLPELVRVLREPLAPWHGREDAAEHLVRLAFASEAHSARSSKAIEDAVQGAGAFLDLKCVQQAAHSLGLVMRRGAARPAPRRAVGGALGAGAEHAPAAPGSDERPAAGGDSAPAPDGQKAARGSQQPMESTLQLLVGMATARLAAQPASHARKTFDALASLINEFCRLRARGPLLDDFLQRSCAWLAAADWGALAASAGKSGPRHAAWILRAWATGWVPESLPPPPPQAVLGLAQLAALAIPGSHHMVDGPGMLLHRIRYLMSAHLRLGGAGDVAAYEAGLAAQRIISQGLAGRLDAVALAALHHGKIRAADRVAGVASALLALKYRPSAELARKLLVSAAPAVAYMDDGRVKTICLVLWKWHQWYGLAYEGALLEAFAASVLVSGRGAREPRRWLSQMLASNAAADSAGAPGEGQGPASGPGVSGEVQEALDLPSVSGEVLAPADLPGASGDVLEPADGPGVSGEVLEPADVSGVSGEVQGTAS